MKVVILAAGKGTRLLPHTLETPKTLIKISGKPIIERIIEALPNEIDEIIIVVKHLREKIEFHLNENYKNKRIVFVEQGEMTGTFGALKSAEKLFGENERFLVTNGDDIHNKQEFEECLKYPRSMAVQMKVMPKYYSIQIDENGFFKGFTKQTENESRYGTLVATGVYVVDSNIFKHPGVVINKNEYGLPQTVLEQVNEYPVMVIKTSGWLPVNSFEDIKIAEENLSI